MDLFIVSLDSTSIELMGFVITVCNFFFFDLRDLRSTELVVDLVVDLVVSAFLLLGWCGGGAGGEEEGVHDGGVRAIRVRLSRVLWVSASSLRGRRGGGVLESVLAEAVLLVVVRHREEWRKVLSCVGIA